MPLAVCHKVWQHLMHFDTQQPGADTWPCVAGTPSNWPSVAVVAAHTVGVS